MVVRITAATYISVAEIIKREDHEEHDDDPQKKDENRERAFEQEVETQAVWSM